MRFSTCLLAYLAQSSHGFIFHQHSTTSKPASKFSSSSSSSALNAVNVNPLVQGVKVSATVQIFSNVKQMQAEGIEVTSLCVGEPDFPPPQAVLDAATRAITNCETRYTAVTGTAELRNAIADDLKERKGGLTYDPNTEIVVGNGAKQCVFQGVLATCGA
eukprot:812585_1